MGLSTRRLKWALSLFSLGLEFAKPRTSPKESEIFRSGLTPFAELVYQRQPYFVDPSSFYRLARLMGHATPGTLSRI